MSRYFNQLSPLYPNRIRNRITKLTSFVLICFLFGYLSGPGFVYSDMAGGEMTEQRALELAEEFGVDVGEVDEEIREFLGLSRAEGVVIFAVIGGTPADLAGVKVKAIIKEVDKFEIKNLIDLGKALEVTLPTQNFTVATYEPSDPSDQGVTGGLNFHFVRIMQD